MRRGFTIIEVMIAIFIAAVMFAIGYGAINQALRDRDAINASQARITEIQRGMRVVAQDFAQMMARPARDVTGTGQLDRRGPGRQHQQPADHLHARGLEQSRGSAATRGATRPLPLPANSR